MSLKIKKISIFLALFLTSILFNSKNSFCASSRNLIIFAEPNLAASLSKISRIFSQKNNVIISINFSSSFDLINEIDSGAPANIFISAHPQIIENLRQKGLVDVYNVGYIASDNLALCTSKSNNKFPSDLLKKNVSFDEALRIINKNKLNLIINHDGDSSGAYSRKILESLSLYDDKVFKKIIEDKTSIIFDIENNKDSFGLIFESQLYKNNNLKILSTQNNKHHFYQALVIAGDNMEVAREFLNFLKTPIVKKIFRESGFKSE